MIASIQNTALRRAVLIAYCLFGLPLGLLFGALMGSLWVLVVVCPNIAHAWGE